MSDTDKKKSSSAAGWLIFILGVIVGIVGLCVAFRLIFYIGLAVVVAGIVALIVGAWRLRRRGDKGGGD